MKTDYGKLGSFGKPRGSGKLVKATELVRQEPHLSFQAGGPRSLSVAVGDQRDRDNLDAIAESDDNELIIRSLEGTWREIQGRFLYIGRLLYRMRENVKNQVTQMRREDGEPYIGRERDLMVAQIFRGDVLDRVQLSRTDAVKLMAVAEAFLVEQRIPLSKIPESYTVAYELALLSHDELQEAEETGLLTPQLTRAELRSFRLGERSASGKRLEEDPRIALDEKIDRLERKLRRLKAQRAELD